MLERIIVLNDLLPTSTPAVLIGHQLAKTSGAELHFVHISSESHPVDSIRDHIAGILPVSTPFQSHVGHGHFNEVIAAFLEKLKPDLIVVCSHGLHGISQHLFGSNIYRLIQSITGRFLVVHENTPTDNFQLKRLFFPASPYADFTRKMQMALDFAEQFQGTITHFEVDKYLIGSEESIAEHRTMLEHQSAQRKIAFESVIEAPTTMSVGFARQTLGYAAEHGFDAICVTANAHDHNAPMGRADKEAMLTNSQGIPLLVYSAGERD